MHHHCITPNVLMSVLLLAPRKVTIVYTYDKALPFSDRHGSSPSVKFLYAEMKARGRFINSKAGHGAQLVCITRCCSQGKMIPQTLSHLRIEEDP